MDPIISNGKKLVDFLKTATDEQLTAELSAAGFGAAAAQGYGVIDGVSTAFVSLAIRTHTTSTTAGICLAGLSLSGTSFEGASGSNTGQTEEMPLAA